MSEVRRRRGNLNSIDNLLVRAQLALENSEYDQADTFFERALDLNAQCATAYLGKLCAHLHVNNTEELRNSCEEFDTYPEWKNAIKFSSSEEQEYLLELLDNAKQKRFTVYYESVYNQCCNQFALIEENCNLEQAENLLAQLKALPDFIDASDMISKCEQHIKWLTQKKKNSATAFRVLIIICICCILSIVGIISYKLYFKPQSIYHKAEEAMSNHDYETARMIFHNLGAYKDAPSRIDESYYLQGDYLFSENNYYEAALSYEKIPNYKDSNVKKLIAVYMLAEEYLDNEEYDSASQAFSYIANNMDPNLPSKYADAESRIYEPYYIEGENYYKIKDYENALVAYQKAPLSYTPTKNRRIEIYYSQAEEAIADGRIDDAYDFFQEAALYVDENTPPELADANNRSQEILYQFALSELSKNNFEKACEYFRKIIDYSDSSEQIVNAHIIKADYMAENEGIDEALSFLVGIIDENERYLEKYQELSYQHALDFIDNEQYEQAIPYLILCETYKDAETLLVDSQLNQAKALVSDEKYAEAFYLLNQISENQEAKSILETNPNLILESRKQIIHSAVGDVVSFGHYEQDKDMTNGKEPIEWIVLDKSENEILLLSKYILDSHLLHTESKIQPWDKSTCRLWLNTSFLNDAFSLLEQQAICTTKVTADLNPEFEDVKQGYDTEDEVFLLSIVEANKYFSSDKERDTESTPYASSNGSDYLGSPRWLLRTLGISDNMPSFVASDGKIIEVIFLTQPYGIRPAIKINLEADYFTTYDTTYATTKSVYFPKEDQISWGMSPEELRQVKGNPYREIKSPAFEWDYRCDTINEIENMILGYVFVDSELTMYIYALDNGNISLYTKLNTMLTEQFGQPIDDSHRSVAEAINALSDISVGTSDIRKAVRNGSLLCQHFQDENDSVELMYLDGVLYVCFMQNNSMQETETDQSPIL